MSEMLVERAVASRSAHARQRCWPISALMSMLAFRA